MAVTDRTLRTVAWHALAGQKQPLCPAASLTSLRFVVARLPYDSAENPVPLRTGFQYASSAATFADS